MTKATRETTKLNFITDQGSTRAMVRCACRAERLDCAFCGVPRVAAGAPPPPALFRRAEAGSVLGGGVPSALPPPPPQVRPPADPRAGRGPALSPPHPPRVTPSRALPA